MASYVNPLQSYSIPDKEYNTNREASRYTGLRSLPETPWDLGFVRLNTPVKSYLYNGDDTPMTFTGVEYDNATGIELTEPTALDFPVTVKPHTGVWLTVMVSLEGPTQFDGRLTFKTDKGDSILRILGVRAPFLSGSTATLPYKHNWQAGFNETLQFNTEILVSYDGSEQRISLLPLPRRSFSLSYIEEKEVAELLGTYLGARRTDFFYIPIWRDISRTTAEVSSGGTIIEVDTAGRDYVGDQKVMIWSQDGSYELLSILTVNFDHLILLDPCVKSYPKGSLVAPVHPFYLAGDVQATRHTDQVTEFKCTMGSVYDYETNIFFVKDVYDGHTVFPVTLNYVAPPDNISHKWDVIDNKTGLPLIVKESEDPIYQDNYQVLLDNRTDCSKFLRFLFDQKGRAIPFYIINKGANLHPDQGWIENDSSLFIKYAQYHSDSNDEKGKRHIQIEYTDGTKSRHAIVDSVFNPLFPEQEELTVSPAFDSDRTLNEIRAIRYLQLVRFGADTFNIKWEAVDKLRCSFTVKVIT